MKNAIQSFKSKTTSIISENNVEEIEIESQTTSKSEEIELLNLSSEEEEYKPTKKQLINQPKIKNLLQKVEPQKRKIRQLFYFEFYISNSFSLI